MSRTLPPVRSPLTVAALVRGWRSATHRAVAVTAERDLRTALQTLGLADNFRFTDSGTSALALALRIAASRTGGLVALPAYGCFDLATAADTASVEFVLYDVDPQTLAPDAHSLVRAVAAGARSVVVAHLYGLPVDIDSLRAALQPDLFWVDDAAQGVGATLHGRPLGTLGDLGILSFGRGKGLTGGAGGALLAKAGTPLAADLARLELAPSTAGALTSLAKAKAQWLLARPGLYAIPRALPFLGLGETRYARPHPAAEISRFALGALAVGAKGVREETEARVRHAHFYRDALRGLELQLPQEPSGAQAGWLRFPILVPPHAVAGMRAPQSARLGIMPGYPSALSSLAGFGERRHNRSEQFPGAEALSNRLMTLPTHGALSRADLQSVLRRVREVVGR